MAELCITRMQICCYSMSNVLLSEPCEKTALNFSRKLNYWVLAWRPCWQARVYGKHISVFLLKHYKKNPVLNFKLCFAHRTQFLNKKKHSFVINKVITVSSCLVVKTLPYECQISCGTWLEVYLIMAIKETNQMENIDQNSYKVPVCLSEEESFQKSDENMWELIVFKLTNKWLCWWKNTFHQQYKLYQNDFDC